VTDVASERDSLGSRIGRLALAFLLGVLFGAVGTVGHRQELSIGGVVLPWGIVAALLGVAGLLVGIRILGGGRLVSAAAAAGLIGTVSLLSLPGAGGSVLVPGGVVGTIWAVGPALIAVLVIAWPSIPTTRRHPA
jgi:hypothetical protein